MNQKKTTQRVGLNDGRLARRADGIQRDARIVFNQMHHGGMTELGIAWQKGEL